jgi:hypothetical protein
VRPDLRLKLSGVLQHDGACLELYQVDNAQFALATRDCVPVQTCDLGKPLHRAMPLVGSLNGRKPATLLLIQAADQQVDLPMQQLIGMGLA